jgi:hypothetical protein
LRAANADVFPNIAIENALLEFKVPYHVESLSLGVVIDTQQTDHCSACGRGGLDSID